MNITNIADLVGVDLTKAGFQIQEATEVYEVNNHEERAKTLGCFKNEKRARAFVDRTKHCRCAKIKILTDGNKMFTVGGTASLFTDEIEISLKRLNNKINEGVEEY